MTRFLLILLFFTLPLVHGRIFPTLGLDIYTNISGNFEFTKVMFFNVFSGIIFFSFFIEKFLLPLKGGGGVQRTEGVWSITLGIILLILSLSTLFSLSPFISLIGDLEKGHTALMFFNLFGLFVVLKNLEKTFLKKLIYTSLLAGILVSLLAIKELFLPTYDYGALGNRAFGSFGHPNYLAGFLLLLIPFFSPFVKGSTRGTRGRDLCFMSILLLGIILSKSIVAIVLALGYIFFQFLFPLIKGDKTMVKIWGIVGIVILTSTAFCLIKYAPEKLHSFLSRFYLWETTLRIIFSNIKIFLIGGGAETLPYLFDSFKVPEVYIYENFGFTADRPHNFSLNIFYHFGVFALGLFVYFVYRFFKKFKNTSENITLLLFLLFGIIHYFSISSYVLVILILASYSHSMASFYKGSSAKQGRIKTRELTIILAITLTSLTGASYSIKLYHSEILYSQKHYIKASENFIHPKYLIKIGDYPHAKNIENTISQSSFKNQIKLLPEKQFLCNNLTTNYPSAENYTYCGNIFWNLGKQEIAKEYYFSGLTKLPDLWNKNSPYWDNYFIKNTITGNRFFSKKHGDINSILEKVGK